jgi:hypothetical protein
MTVGAKLAVEAVENDCGLLGAAMGHQPARRFRQPQAHEEDGKPEHGADEKGQTPTDIRGQQRGIEQHDRTQRAERGAEPEAAVDDEIGPATITRRHHLLDGRIDSGVLAADAGASEETKQREAPQAPRQCGGSGGREIDRKRDEEQPLAPEPIGEPAEDESAQHRAGEISAAGKADIGIGEVELRALLQGRRHGAGERHLKPVKHPGDAERDHHQGMEAAPGQPVEARRDIGFDDRPACRRKGRSPRLQAHRRLAYSHYLPAEPGHNIRSRQRFVGAGVPWVEPEGMPPTPTQPPADQ